MDSIIADIVIPLSLIILAGSLAITLYSIIHSQKVNKRESKENGVPVRMIGWGTIGLVVTVAVPTLLLGSFTDMCIITSITLLLICSFSVILGKVITLRLRKRVYKK